jgi:hypothetical protein
MEHGVRTKLWQTLAGTTAAVVVLAGTAACAREAVAGDPAPAPPAATGGTADAGDTRDLAIYLEVLRRYLSSPNDNSFPERTFQRVFVLDRAVPGIGDPQAHAQPAAGVPIPAATQQRIAAALTDLGPVAFVADRKSVIVTRDGCDVVKDGGVLITLGPVGGDGDRVEVGINGYVACLGATWLTYVVERTAGSGWRVTGTTGPMAIS